MKKRDGEAIQCVSHCLWDFRNSIGGDENRTGGLRGLALVCSREASLLVGKKTSSCQRGGKSQVIQDGQRFSNQVLVGKTNLTRKISPRGGGLQALGTDLYAE